MSVKIPERPGSFRDLYSLIAPRNVTEFSYRFHSKSHADVIISFQAKGLGDERLVDRDLVIAELEKSGFSVSDLSQNELGKVSKRLHVDGDGIRQTALG